MTLDIGVFCLVLLAAVLHATWNALVKAGGDRLVTIALVMITAGVPALLALPFLPFPAAAAWPYLIASVAIHLVYFLALVYAYEHGDLSQVYPIARGTAPMLVALGAWLLAGEALSPYEVTGVLVVSAGIISLAWRRGVRPPQEAKAIGFALLTALTIGTYSVSDGLGVRAAGNAFSYIAWLFFISGIPIFLIALWRRRGRVRAVFGPALRPGIGGGIVAGTAYGFVIWAMSVAPMAHIVALRETSVLIAAAIGTLVLKEPFGRHRIAAAAVIASGAVLLNAGP